MEIIYICIYIILCTCLFLFAICLFSIFPREICKSLIEKWKCGKRLEWNEILKMKDDLLSISFYEFFPQLFFWCLISLAFLSLEIVSGSKHFEIFQTKFTDVSWLCERTSSQNTLIIVVTEHCIIQIHNIQYCTILYAPLSTGHHSSQYSDTISICFNLRFFSSLFNLHHSFIFLLRLCLQFLFLLPPSFLSVYLSTSAFFALVLSFVLFSFFLLIPSLLN